MTPDGTRVLRKEQRRAWKGVPARRAVSHQAQTAVWALEVNEAMINATGRGGGWWHPWRIIMERTGRISVLTPSIGGDRVRVLCNNQINAAWLRNVMTERGIPNAAVKARRLAETEVRAEAERLAAEHSNGHDRIESARTLAHPDLSDDELVLRWADFCEAARNRDDVAEPAVRDWREILDEDAATSQQDAHEVLAGRADEAFAALRTHDVALGRSA